MVDQPLLPPTAPDEDARAAELALGLLDGAERAAALRRWLSDPAFAADVEAWRLRLSPLLDAIPAATPPMRVWRAVEARVDTGTTATIVRRLRLWRGGALISGALAASLAVFIVLRPAELRVPTPVAVSQLAGTQGTATMAIAYDAKKGVLRLSPTTLDSPTKSPELWVIPDDGVPRSLGIIRAGSRDLPIDAGLRPLLKGGVTLAITLEDAATAPHQAPSATPILTGKITII